MKQNAMKRLKEMHLADFQRQHPGFPPHAIPAPKYSEGDTNGLTACIIAFIRLSGGAAFRINSQGQYDQQLKRYRKSGSTPGVPDIIGIWRGQFLGVEVKRGGDKLNEDQQRRAGEIMSAGGAFFEARNLDSFADWFGLLQDANTDGQKGGAR